MQENVLSFIHADMEASIEPPTSLAINLDCKLLHLPLSLLTSHHDIGVKHYGIFLSLSLHLLLFKQKTFRKIHLRTRDSRILQQICGIQV